MLERFLILIPRRPRELHRTGTVAVYSYVRLSITYRERIPDGGHLARCENTTAIFHLTIERRLSQLRRVRLAVDPA